MRRLAFLFGLGLGVSGCSGTSNLIGSSEPQAPQKLEVEADLCPRVDVRDGTNVYRIGPDSPTEVRYQATITDTVRECSIEGNSMRLRIGIEGRMVSGPKGGAGTVNLPIRLSLLKDLNGPVITSKLRSHNVSVGGDAPASAFAFIEEGISFILPPPEEARRYIVFVGFDSSGRSGDAPARRKKRR